MTVAEAFAHSELFDGLPAEFLRQLERAGRPRRFAAGDTLMVEGEVGLSVHLLMRGRVRVQRAHPALPRPLVLAELGAGEVVGEAAVLDGEPRSATVTALQETETLELGADVLSAALLRHPRASAALLRIFSRRLRNANELAVDILRESWRAEQAELAQRRVQAERMTATVDLYSDSTRPPTLLGELADYVSGIGRECGEWWWEQGRGWFWSGWYWVSLGLLVALALSWQVSRWP